VVSLYYNVDTGLGLTQPSIQRVPRVKLPRPEFGRSPPCNGRVLMLGRDAILALVSPRALLFL